MANLPGVFIVLEGADGSGKSTQFRLSIERLKAVGHEVEVFKFPQYDSHSSSFVKAYLNGEYGLASEVSPYTASLFYALDRYHASSSIKQALSKGKVVVADRYVGSNMAHQGSKFTNFAEQRGFFLWEDSLEFELLGIPRPDINIFLRVPVGISTKLMGSRTDRAYTDKKFDQHEADKSHLEKTIAAYDLLCKLFPKDFKEINCAPEGEMLSIVQINNQIWHIIRPFLPEPKLKGKGAIVKLGVDQTNPKVTAKPHVGTNTGQDALVKTKASVKKLNNDSRAYEQALADISSLRRRIQQTKGVDKTVIDSALALCSPLGLDYAWLSKIIPEPKKSSKDNNKPMAINKILDEISTPMPPSTTKSIELKIHSVIPRNELDILDRQRSANLTYQQKHSALLDSVPASFEKLSYSFNGSINYSVFKSMLESDLVLDAKAAYPSPVLGYETLPEVLEHPLLLELYDNCFILSASTYGRLLNSGATEIAPKILLTGHLNSWQFKLNINNLAAELKSSASAKDKEVLRILAGLISEVHPIVGQVLFKNKIHTKTSRKNS